MDWPKLSSNSHAYSLKSFSFGPVAASLSYFGLKKFGVLIMGAGCWAGG
jgi:hypothetical protein